MRDGRSDLSRADGRRIRAADRLHRRLRAADGEVAVNLEYWLSGAIVVLLLGYLMFSLLYPERF
jgi:K+-transporting ATPase KdpF subunit